MSMGAYRLCFFGLIAVAAYAQADFSGNWSPLYHEDLPDRIPGPELGDYTGIPINDAARLRADSYDADRISVVSEYECRPHGADYSMRGLANMRVDTILDPVTQRPIAFHTRMWFQEMERTIWLDGRAHPSEFAPHTWQGFSTASWQDNMMNVYTTHLKESYLKRNGLPRSDKATFTEHWVRHGNYLTVATVITDPAFLDGAARAHADLGARPLAGDDDQTSANPRPRSPIGRLTMCPIICPEPIPSCTKSRIGTGCPTKLCAAAPKPSTRSIGKKWASRTRRRRVANDTANAARADRSVSTP